MGNWLFHFIVSKIVVRLKRKLQMADDSYYTMYINHVDLLGYLQKTFHDENLQGLLHYGYQVLYREVYHAALEPPEAILLTQTI